MARRGDRRVRRWARGILLATAALLVLEACHPQEPPGKRDSSTQKTYPQSNYPPREPY
jgi:hypothetical protein